jgi:isopenicillin-N epimerase
MEAIGADFYTSNGHKWLCSPKGSAFLYARQEMQGLLEPLVVGWGWGANAEFSYGSSFLDNMQWLGTNDFSAYLAVPAAIEFQEEQGWAGVRRRCHTLLGEAMARIGELTGLPAVYGSKEDYVQMGIVPLPPLVDGPGLKAGLYERFRVEVPLIEWGGRPFLRISVQGYNDEGDVDALVGALKELLPE